MKFPKPSQLRLRRPFIKIFGDGREVINTKIKAGKEEYERRIQIMWLRQGKKCVLRLAFFCKLSEGLMPLTAATFDHERCRGNGGAFRDDRVEIDGNQINLAVCALCNSIKGSRSIAQLALTWFYCRHCGLRFPSQTLIPCPCCGMDEAEPQQEVA